MGPGTAFVRLFNARLIKTSSFRMAMGYALLFIISVSGLFGFLYWNTAVFIAEQTEETIEAEITGLAEHYRQIGLVGVRDVIVERSRGERESLYLLTEPNRRVMVGNLDTWPNAQTQPGGWIDFDYARPFGNRTKVHQARARHLILPGGFHLLVGRDIQDLNRFELRLKRSLAWLSGLALILGGIVGLVMSRNWLRRVDAVNRTAAEIMDGDMTHRIPVRDTDDELDRLAVNLNAMLDRIEGLMAGLRQVTDNIAHDLRSPLNRLRSRLEVTLLEDPDKPGYRQALESTVADADQLLQTFNALLLIGEAEAGLDRHALAEVDLSALVADMAELFGPAAEENGQHFSADIAPDVVIRANANLISQALVNLLDNALKYTPAGGDVSISLTKVDDCALIDVADSGPGIPEVDRARVLGRFVRLESSRSSPGSGLGLSLVAAAAKLHGAKLDLIDNEPGLRVRLKLCLIE